MLRRIAHVLEHGHGLPTDTGPCRRPSVACRWVARNFTSSTLSLARHGHVFYTVQSHAHRGSVYACMEKVRPCACILSAEVFTQYVCACACECVIYTRAARLLHRLWMLLRGGKLSGGLGHTHTRMCCMYCGEDAVRPRLTTSGGPRCHTFWFCISCVYIYTGCLRISPLPPDLLLDNS